MSKLIQITSIFLLPAFTACSDGNPVQPSVPELTVRLEGTIGLSTRAVIGSDCEEELEVVFARQDETTASAESYGEWSVCKAVREGGVGNRPIVFDEPQWYPPDGRDIHLHGYYPAGNGTVDVQAGKVTFAINGKTDIMATGCLSGSTYEPVHTCTFRHLLTQIAWICYGDRPELWGVVTKIEAVEVHTLQELDYRCKSPSLTDVSSEGGIQNLAVQDIIGLTVSQVMEGGELPDPQGYILLPVSPADGTAEHPLHLLITTTKDGRGNAVETVIPASVRVEGGFLPGRRHVVSLFFSGNGVVRISSVRVEAWTEYDAGELPI
ncbi:fimbrillin family protein [Parabacteroides timonensis]|uniref:fimbrillin family protein n=1 Tax=Parabacteroides timonensis TaxID=1871013 RepID=UPI00094E636C|nr:fimbrillin family protein [Parabacteroides timonensis]